MEIELKNLGRRYNRQWIFSGLSLNFSFPSTHAILGPNGSGKSTLLQIISGYLSSSEGQVNYYEFDPESKSRILVEKEKIYKKISFAAPYLEIPNSFSVKEFLDFHFGLKGVYPLTNRLILLEQSGLIGQEKKLVGALSSGMLQRLKLIATMGSNTAIVLLDEPTQNLDDSGFIWFKEMFLEMSKTRTILLGSNSKDEYELCKNYLNILEFKKQKR